MLVCSIPYPLSWPFALLWCLGDILCGVLFTVTYFSTNPKDPLMMTTCWFALLEFDLLCFVQCSPRIHDIHIISTIKLPFSVLYVLNVLLYPPPIPAVLKTLIYMSIVWSCLTSVVGMSLECYDGRKKCYESLMSYDALPRSSHECPQDTECAVCPCVVCASPTVSEVYIMRQCNHSIHYDCALKWFQTIEEVQCPICRSVDALLNVRVDQEHLTSHFSDSDSEDEEESDLIRV